LRDILSSQIASFLFDDMWSGVAKRLGCPTVTHVPGVQSSSVTLVAQHVPGAALEATRARRPHNEFLTDVGQTVKFIVYHYADKSNMAVITQP